MAVRYSRLESTEEKKNYRSAIVLLTSSVLVVLLLIVYGIPAVGRLASFVSGLKGGSLGSTKDTTPPAPPSFNIYPDFTNQQKISISGTAESGITIKLTFNENVSETVVDKNGNFMFQDLALKEGDNKFSAVAIDNSKNISQKTLEKYINFDTKPPTLEISSPADGTNFFGNSQRQINIQGSTEPTANMTINDRVVSIDINGQFQYPVTLNAGENTFNLKAVDKAGNNTEKIIALNFNE